MRFPWPLQAEQSGDYFGIIWLYLPFWFLSCYTCCELRNSQEIPTWTTRQNIRSAVQPALISRISSQQLTAQLHHSCYIPCQAWMIHLDTSIWLLGGGQGRGEKRSRGPLTWASKWEFSSWGSVDIRGLKREISSAYVSLDWESILIMHLLMLFQLK